MSEEEEDDDVEVRAGAEAADLVEGGVDVEVGARDEVDEVEVVGAADWRLGGIEGGEKLVGEATREIPLTL